MKNERIKINKIGIGKKIKKITKKFRELKNINKFLWIFAISAIILYLIMIPLVFIIFIRFSFQVTYAELLESLGFELQGPLKIFFLWASLLLPILLLNLIIKKRINLYLWIGIFLSLFLILFGLGFIGETYKADLPASIYWKSLSEVNYLNEEKCAYTRLDCKSVKDKLNFVEGDEIYCTFEIEENCSFWISDFKVKRNYLNSEDFMPLEVETITKNLVVFRFEVEKNLQDLWVYPSISNGSYSDTLFWALLELNEIYSDGEYLSLKQTKSLAIITLISICLFSTFVAMNNLKQLLKKH